MAIYYTVVKKFSALILKVQILGAIGLKSIIKCLILLETRNPVVTTIEESVVSFLQHSAASPSYLLQGTVSTL